MTVLSRTDFSGRASRQIVLADKGNYKTLIRSLLSRYWRKEWKLLVLDTVLNSNLLQH